MQVSSSIGRAAVSKTAGRRFDSCLTCHFFEKRPEGHAENSKQDLEDKMKNPIAAIKKLYDETVAELKKCTWPTRQELYESTMVVVSSLVLLSVFVFVADKVFLLAVNLITGMR